MKYNKFLLQYNFNYFLTLIIFEYLILSFDSLFLFFEYLIFWILNFLDTYFFGNLFLENSPSNICHRY